MGNLEKSLKSQIRRTNVSKIILSAIAVTGLMSMALIAPNALQVMKMFDGNNKRKRSYDNRFKSSLLKLIDEGAIRRVEKSGKIYFEITNKGLKKLGDLYRYQMLLVKPKRWDGKWRVVSFDIYEKRRNARDKFRYTLKSLGFLQLHKSMWIYPYDCEDLITLMKSEFKMGKNVLYIIADRVEADKKLKEHFSLP